MALSSLCKKLFYFMFIGVSLSMYACGSCKSGVSRTKRTLNTLELQLHVVVSSHVDAEN